MQEHLIYGKRQKGYINHESYFIPMPKELIMWYTMTPVLIP